MLQRDEFWAAAFCLPVGVGFGFTWLLMTLGDLWVGWALLASLPIILPGTVLVGRIERRVCRYPK